MAFQIGIGVSREKLNSFSAGQLAAQDAGQGLGVEAPQIVVVMSSPMFFQEELIRGVRSVYPQAPLIGCSTAGLITSDGPLEKAVGVLLLHSDTMSFSPIRVDNISKGMRAAGKQFGERVSQMAGGPPKGAFIFSDALSGNGTELVRGVFETLGTGFPLMGGAAGDDMAFKKTYQYCNDEVLSDAAVGFAVGGNVSFAAGADHGWRPIGKELTVTKAEGTTLYELDGKPAFSIYEDYFGDAAKKFKNALSLPAVTYPLGMKTGEGKSEYYMIRVPLAVKDDGSIMCGAEVIEGSKVRLMIGDIDTALLAAEARAKSIVERTADSRPRLAFLSDCVARKVLFGRRIGEEIEKLNEFRAQGIVLFGFYSYGQIAPLREIPANVNTCDPGFYEQSLSIAVMGEE